MSPEAPPRPIRASSLPGRGSIALAGLLLLFAGGCGYRPLRSLPATAGELNVVAGPSQVPDVTLVGDAVYGAQAALAREARLGRGGYPRLVVEVVRVDERSSGVLGFEGQPLARGASLGLLGRAWVLDAPGASARFDTGDVRVAADIAAETDPRLDALRRDDALRALARRLGEALAGRVLGLPTPLDERL